MPRASVCMSAFNKPNHLREVLASIVRQRGDFEVIVVDDGSEDAAVRSVCKDFPSVRCLRIERDPTFRNPCTARNLAYREARGDVIICQSDDVVHVSENSVMTLCDEMRDGHFVIATVWNRERDGRLLSQFTGAERRKPYFFLGALRRKDLYAVGGNDEDFSVGTGYEDAWFSFCLTEGLGLAPTYTEKVVGHHLWHQNYNTLQSDDPSRKLYQSKLRRAKAGEIPWCSSSGPWPMDEPSSERIFTRIYRENSWGGEESHSGVGSSLDSTRVVREKLPDLIRSYGIRSVLDVGCGDCHWMSRVDLGGASYVGVDTVAELVEENRRRFPNLEFRHLDGVYAALPQADLVICRDYLVHLSDPDVFRALRNIRRSGARYLLATTFPNHGNRAISTGAWAPMNLEQSPYDLPRPLAIINEDCRESYPYFNDKSLGLWRTSCLPRHKTNAEMRSLVVCVEYDDFLEITLPRNLHHFSETTVVTSTRDERTVELAQRSGCQVYKTDAFYRYGAQFNKGMAIEEAFDEMGRSGWLCIWDADVVMPDEMDLQNLDPSCLYVPERRILPDPSAFKDGMDWKILDCPTKPHEFDGYFQLFHCGALREKPWYGITWRHAGGGDSDFEFKFDEDRKRRLLFSVLHLGAEGPDRIGLNWTGRVTARIDGESVTRLVPVYDLRAKRRTDGLAGERVRPRILTPDRSSPIAGDGRIERTMRFFWQGRMSFMRYLTLLSFRRHNPSWRMVLYRLSSPVGERTWDSDERDDREYDGEDYAERVEDLGVEVVEYVPPIAGLAPAQSSDLFQWQVLSEESGWYSDMDVLWVRQFDDIHEAMKGHDAVFCLESGYLAIGLFGSSGGGRMFRDVLQLGTRQADFTDYQRLGSHLIYSMASVSPRKANSGLAVLETLKEMYHSESIGEVPSQVVYPFDWREIDDIFERRKRVPSGTCGIHWFGGSDTAGRWNKLLTEQNWFEHLNTFTYYMESLTRSER